MSGRPKEEIVGRLLGAGVGEGCRGRRSRERAPILEAGCMAENLMGDPDDPDDCS